MTKSVIRIFFSFIIAFSAASAGFAGEPAEERLAGSRGLVSISIDDVSANESDGSMTFTVSLSETPTANVSMNYSTSNGSARSGDDYISKSGTLTIPSGLTSGTITINLINDNIDENSETFNVNLSNPSANASIQDNQGRGTILDNDSPPSISVSNASADEGDGTISFNVTLSSASGKDIDVDYSTSDGSAEAGSDYTAKSGNVFISAGSTSGSITIAVIDDNLDEPDESFSVGLSNANNAGLADATASGTIRDNDSQPALSINDASADEGDGTMSFTVSLSKVSGKQVKVDFSTANGSARASSDFTDKSGTLTFSPGNTSQKITISIIDDGDDEDDEDFTVELSNQQNADIGDGQGRGVIRDNDLPSLSINDLSASEGGGPMSFTVSLSRPNTMPVMVQYSTSDGSASSGDDYTGTSGNITIPAGMSSNTIFVSLVDDDAYENDEDFFVTLANPTNATIKDKSGKGTILNDDFPTLTIDDVSVDENAGKATFTVKLSSSIPDDVTVDFQSRDSTATAGSDYTENSGKLTFISGVTTQTIDIDIKDDTVDEDDEFFIVELKNPINATLASSRGIATIVDNDVTPSLAINDVAGTEGAGSVTFTVSLSQPSPNTITVDYATADSSAAAGQDYAAKSGTLTFNPGSMNESITISLVDDQLDEGAENLIVELKNPGNATISDGVGVGQIQDDDDSPFLSIDDVIVQEPETNTTSMLFTVSLSKPSGRDISFAYASFDSTATSPDDYMSISDSKTILAGDTTASIMVIVESDTLAEIDEFLTIKIGTPINASLADSVGVGTILGNITLSVTLESFEAKTGTNSVELNWTTRTESGNAGFNILRSNTEASGYEKLNSALVPGAGTSNEAHSYTFADTSAQSRSTYFYKLVSVHNDGTVYTHPPIEFLVGLLTSIDEEIVADLPTDFSLAQNFPNPFNPQTIISYSLPNPSDVRLSIYALNGRLIRTLVAGKMAAGTHRIVWDATDVDGRQVASGTYLYILKTDHFQQQRKLLFLK